jgi:hypothetical protein
MSLIIRNNIFCFGCRRRTKDEKDDEPDCNNLFCGGCQTCFESDNETFRTFFGWALESYKKEVEGFEIFNVISRTAIIVGSTIMYPNSRFITHMVFMIWSILLHLRYRPYKDRNSNIAAILFCICDILGAITAYQAFRSDASVVLQIIFILTTFITLMVIATFILHAIREQANSLRTGLKGENNDIFSPYSRLEKILLFPILSIVWIFVSAYRMCCLNSSRSNATKIQPRKRGAKKKRRKKKERKHARTKTQLKTLMIVTRQLHSFYNDQEAQEKVVAEKQRKSHQRLQERLAKRKSVQLAVKDHKAVLAALQAQKEGFTVDVGEALARDVDWRTHLDEDHEDSGINHVVGDFDLEELPLEHDAIIDEYHEGGVFRDALDDSLIVRRQSSLKLLNALQVGRWPDTRPNVLGVGDAMDAADTADFDSGTLMQVGIWPDTRPNMLESMDAADTDFADFDSGTLTYLSSDSEHPLDY